MEYEEGHVEKKILQELHFFFPFLHILFSKWPTLDAITQIKIHVVIYLCGCNGCQSHEGQVLNDVIHGLCNQHASSVKCVLYCLKF